MKKLIIGNWKMNPKSGKEATEIFRKIKIKAGRATNAKAILAVPYVYIENFAKNPGKVKIAAQDVFWEAEGAYTGKVSAGMLKKMGVSHVIIGHSELRAMGDTNKIVNRKIRAVMEQKLTAILCIGEVERDQDGEYLRFLRNEIEESLHGISPAFFKNIIIAYEPIWAIGAKATRAASPDDFLEKKIFIQKTLVELCGKDIALSLPIIYGGSVNENNVEEFLSRGQADGVLPGRASLDPEQFGFMLSISSQY